MSRLRVATFNIETLRLVARPGGGIGLGGARDDDEDRAAGEDAAMLDALDRMLSVQLIKDADADVVALQEVEDLVALDAFHDHGLVPGGAAPYPRRVLFDGNDGRGFDVALLSRAPVLGARSHAADTFADLGVPPPDPSWSPGTRVFRRDCLETDVRAGLAVLTLYVCHFKAMDRTRAETRAVRLAEARAVRTLIERRFPDPAAALWMILGDLNDHAERDGAPEPETALGPLLEDGFSVDLLARIPDPRERWTYHYAPLDIYARPDHLLASPALAARNPDAVPEILRMGMWRIARRYEGPRYQEVGEERPRASDHALVVVELEV